MKLLSVYSVLFVSFVVICASATEHISLTQTGAEHYHPPGTELEAEVGWYSDAPIDGLRTWICWDDRLVFVDCEWTDEWADQWLEADPNGLYIECTGAETWDGGPACVLTFRIRDDAEPGYVWVNFREPWPRAQQLADDYWWTVATSVYWGAIVVTPLGDCNCDGSVNALDIDPFVAALSGDVAYDLIQPMCNRWLADCNGDGTLDALDVDVLVERISGV
ncbi:MAG: dockerin type I repeat-containing protein [Phycisphaerae bacterium]|nr:dockerin type I repeat-containing protein [Phycisphaerae bacterium]